MARFEQLTGTGLFVGTTNVWDVNQVYAANIENPQLEELLVRLYQNICDISIALNLKDSGLYFGQQFINGQTFFPNPANTSQTQTAPAERQVYRLTINFGPLPNATSTSVPHGIPITSMTTFTRIYATASDTTGKNYIPIPYVENTGNNIGINVNSTNVTITTVDDRTNFNVCYVILEYMQN